MFILFRLSFKIYDVILSASFHALIPSNMVYMYQYIEKFETLIDRYIIYHTIKNIDFYRCIYSMSIQYWLVCFRAWSVFYILDFSIWSFLLQVLLRGGRGKSRVDRGEHAQPWEKGDKLWL